MHATVDLDRWADDGGPTRCEPDDTPTPTRSDPVFHDPVDAAHNAAKNLREESSRTAAAPPLGVRMSALGPVLDHTTPALGEVAAAIDRLDLATARLRGQGLRDTALLDDAHRKLLQTRFALHEVEDLIRKTATS